jgi:hypothetical protein
MKAHSYIPVLHSNRAGDLYYKGASVTFATADQAKAFGEDQIKNDPTLRMLGDVVFLRAEPSEDAPTNIWICARDGCTVQEFIDEQRQAA